MQIALILHFKKWCDEKYVSQLRGEGMKPKSKQTHFVLMLIIFEREREGERENEWERGRERRRQNLKQDPGSELSAQSLIQGLNSQTV